MDMNMEMYKISSVLNKIILQIIWLCFFLWTQCTFYHVPAINFTNLFIQLFLTRDAV